MSWSVELWPGEITVDRDKRQRRELTGIDELAESIRTRSQLQPIVITRDHVLVAGERRFTAVSKLADRPLRCMYIDEIDPIELQAIELEENVKRSDLTWQDMCVAICTYHDLKVAQDPAWTQAMTGKSLGLAEPTILAKINVARALVAKDPLVSSAPKYSTARGIVARAAERRGANEVASIMALATKPKVSEDVPTEIASILDDLDAGATGYILNEDFKFWAENYNGPKFNFIHCDFPYGVGMHESDQSSREANGSYEDTPEIYWALIDTLLNYLDNFCAESAHMIFWFSMDFYEETRLALGTKFNVSPFPLVWVKSDNSGILPDANRGPRRTYETAFFCTRGDRKIVRAVSNHIASPIQRGRHMSEKPQLVLNHFFRMVVDENSTVLDPTCGSGSAVRAAITAGASGYLGLELNSEFADHADETLKHFLEDRNNAKPA